MYLCLCGGQINKRRWALGFKTCLDCGDKAAAVEIHKKSLRVGQMHKSNLVYMGSDETALQTLRDITNMRRTQ